MPSKKEIRAVMYRAEHGGPIYGNDMQTLAACVRELYGAIQEGLSPLAEYKNRAMETVNHYRAALEGDDDAE
jgi:hypothetical protein